MPEHSSTPVRFVETVVSGEVTLALYRSEWQGKPLLMRFDGSALPIDSAPLEWPAAWGHLLKVLPLPEGFAFISSADGQIHYVRISLRRGWIDREPRVILNQRWIEDAAVSTDRIILAWTNRTELLTTSVSLEGQPLQSEPHRVAVYEAEGQSLHIRLAHLASSGSRHLAVLTEPVDCWTLCIIPELPLHVVPLDSRGRAEGRRITPAIALGPGPPVPLADGTWLLPIRTDGGVELLHLARSGALLSVRQTSVLDRLPSDVRAVTGGWEALVPSPLRLIRFQGLSGPAEMLGLAPASSAAFAYSDWMAYAGRDDFSLALEPRSQSSTDVSLDVRDITRRGHAREFEIIVRNNHHAPATGLYLTYDSPLQIEPDDIVTTPPTRRQIELPDLAPGEVRIMRGRNNHPTSYPRPHLIVLSRDMVDIGPADNIAIAAPADGSGRKRGIRR